MTFTEVGTQTVHWMNACVAESSVPHCTAVTLEGSTLFRVSDAVRAAE